MEDRWDTIPFPERRVMSRIFLENQIRKFGK